MKLHVLALELDPAVGNGVITDHPPGMTIDNFEFSEALRLADRFPSRPTYAFSADYPEHRAVCDLQANTLGFFVVSARLRKTLSVEPFVEHLEIRLANHRGEVGSDSHTIANFLNPVDCIDIERSDLELSEIFEGRIERIRSLVIDPTRVPENRHAFRLAGSHRTVVVRDELRRKIDDAGLTGMLFVPTEQFDSALHVGV